MSATTTDPCSRCGEEPWACECPATTVMFREMSRNPGHVRLAVWVGRNPGARGHAGELTLRTDEWDELAAVPRTAGGILLLPVETQDIAELTTGDPVKADRLRLGWDTRP